MRVSQPWVKFFLWTSIAKTVAIFPKHAFFSDLFFANFKEISTVQVFGHSLKNIYDTEESKPILERGENGLPLEHYVMNSVNGNIFSRETKCNKIIMRKQPQNTAATTDLIHM